MVTLEKALHGKVVLAGVGMLGRGDDAFGPLLARRLSDTSNLRVIDCGDRLEDFTGDIVREAPDTILVADAVDMGCKPGSFALFTADDLRDESGGTHHGSLKVTMNYLKARTGATVLLCGMQPAAVTDRDVLSPEVSSGLESLLSILRGWSVQRGSTSTIQLERACP